MKAAIFEQFQKPLSIREVTGSRSQAGFCRDRRESLRAVSQRLARLDGT
jgi:hypothetical protein